MNQITEEQFLCNMLEVTYNKIMKEYIKNTINEIYPFGWFSIKDYKFKINVLNEAIKNKILIKNTVLYKNNLEGVKK